MRWIYFLVTLLAVSGLFGIQPSWGQAASSDDKPAALQMQSDQFSRMLQGLQKDASAASSASTRWR